MQTQGDQTMKLTRVQARRLDSGAQIAVRVLAVTLSLAAVIWVLITPEDWAACLVLSIAALTLASVGRGEA